MVRVKEARSQSYDKERAEMAVEIDGAPEKII